MEDKTNEAGIVEIKKKEQKKGKIQKEQKKEFRKPIVEEEMEIARMIEIRMVEKMVPRRFYKYLEMFEKKKSERMPTRKIWDYAIDLREGFVPKKEKIYPLSRIERKEVQEFVKN